MPNPTTEISSYPSNFEDTGNSWPIHSSGDSLTTTLANRIRNSILSIQKELGINPSGGYSTVGLKLDNLAETYQPQFTINSSNEGYFRENDFLLFQDCSVDSDGFDRKVAIGWDKELEVFYLKKDADNGTLANLFVASTIFFNSGYLAPFTFDETTNSFFLGSLNVQEKLLLSGATSNSNYIKVGNSSYIWEQSSVDLRFHVGRYISFRRGDSTQSLNSAYIDLDGSNFCLYSEVQGSTRIIASYSDLQLTTAANNKKIILNAHGTGYVNFLNDLGFVIGSGTTNGMSCGSSGQTNIFGQTKIGFFPNATSPSSLGNSGAILEDTSFYPHSSSGTMDIGKPWSAWKDMYLKRACLTISTPSKPTAAISGSGSVLIGSYIYKVSCVDLVGTETSPSVSSNPVSVTTNNVAISIQFTSVPGARGYNIYRSGDGGMVWRLVANNFIPSAHPAPVNGTYSGNIVTYADNLSSPSSSSLPSQGAAYSSMFNVINSFVFGTTESDDTYVFTIAGGPSGYCNHARSLFRIMSGTAFLTMGFNNYGKFEIFSPANIDFVSGTRGYNIMQLSITGTEVSTYKKLTNSFTTDIASNTTQMQIGYRSIRFAQQTGDEGSAGTLLYRRWDTTALEIIGAGAGSSRLVRIYDHLGIGTTAGTSFRINANGPININSAVSSGAALYCTGQEIIWRNGTYISWGYSTTYNFWDKPLTIGSSTNPNNTSLWVTGKALASTACVIRQGSTGGGTPANVFTVQDYLGNSILSISPSSELTVNSVKAKNVTRIIYNSQTLVNGDGQALYHVFEEFNSTPVIKCMGKYIYRTGDKRIRCWFMAKTGQEWSFCSGGYSLWVNGTQVAFCTSQTGGFWDIIAELYWDIEGLVDGTCMDVGLAAQSGGCNQHVYLKEAVIVVEST